MSEDTIVGPLEIKKISQEMGDLRLQLTRTRDQIVSLQEGNEKLVIQLDVYKSVITHLLHFIRDNA